MNSSEVITVNSSNNGNGGGSSHDDNNDGSHHCIDSPKRSHASNTAMTGTTPGQQRAMLNHQDSLPISQAGDSSERESFHSSYGSLPVSNPPDEDSVRSDHADDYYNGVVGSEDEDDDLEEDDISGASGVESLPGSYYGGIHASADHLHIDGASSIDDHDDGGGSEASSIRSLQSCEIIATSYTTQEGYGRRRSSTGTGGGGGGEESYYESYFTDDGEEESSMPYYDDEHDDEIEDDDSLSLGFPPGHITHLDELNELQNHADGPLSISRHESSDAEQSTKRRNSSINPSIIPTYFFCPLTKSIMIDPVITPDGNTYERRAILRSLILEEVDPISKNPLNHEELAEDYLVRQSIDKARKEAWVRYVVEFEDNDGDNGDNDDDGHGHGGDNDDGGVDVEDGMRKSLREIRRMVEVQSGRSKEYGELYDKVNSPNNKEGNTEKKVRDQDGSDSSHDVNGGISGGDDEQLPRSISPPHSSHKSMSSPQKRGDDPPASSNISPMNSTLSPSSPQIASPPSEDSLNSSYNHGWSVPLGVHEISCAPPGLVVTADVHRRSNVVKRKIIKKSLVDGDGKSDGNNNNNGNGNTGTNNGTRNPKKGESKKKLIRRRRKKKNKKPKNLKTTTSVITRDLILPPGSHVEILETRVHGGRVRGRIVWEEEVVTEVDDELRLLLEEEEVRKRAMARPSKNAMQQGQQSQQSQSNKRGSGSVGKSSGAPFKFFRKKSSTGTAATAALIVEDRDKLPFSNELFDKPPHPTHPYRRSPSPLTTIKYNGWISLGWAGISGNYEREEALKRRRSNNMGDGNKSSKVVLAADDDEGPWTRPLPLGVYRISSNDDTSSGNKETAATPTSTGSSVKQLPLYDAPNSESNIVDFLVCNQCLEVVETQVLMMKQTKEHGTNDDDTDNNSLNPQVMGVTASGSGDGGPIGKQVVRARCMVPVIVSPLNVENFASGTPTEPQRKFRSGWITLSESGNKATSPSSSSSSSSVVAKSTVTATPIPLGAYVVTTTDPLLSCDANSKIKSILPSGSCMEVVTTRIEFEENTKLMKCAGCGREGMYYSVAVRALIASGGYVTLFVASVGTSGNLGSLCGFCGRVVEHVVYAEPVPLGTYRMVSQPSTTTLLTRDVGLKSPVIMQLKEGSCVRVVETRVEEGCVRGRVNIVVDVATADDNSNGKEGGGGSSREKDTRKKSQKESVTGWVSLFEPPSFKWAELVSSKR